MQLTPALSVLVEVNILHHFDVFRRNSPLVLLDRFLTHYLHFAQSDSVFAKSNIYILEKMYLKHWHALKFVAAAA